MFSCAFSELLNSLCCHEEEIKFSSLTKFACIFFSSALLVWFFLLLLFWASNLGLRIDFFRKLKRNGTLLRAGIRGITNWSETHKVTWISTCRARLAVLCMAWLPLPCVYFPSAAHLCSGFGGNLHNPWHDGWTSPIAAVWTSSGPNRGSIRL